MGPRQPSGTHLKTHLYLLEMCEISLVDAAMFGHRTIIKQCIWGHQIKGY